jgi:Fic family protein
VKLQAEQAESSQAAAHPAESTHSLAENGQVDRLLRRFDGMQQALDAKEAVIRRLRRELHEVYSKATGAGLTDDDLRHALESALTRAEKAERRLADLRRAMFARRAMKVAGVSRKWHPHRGKGKATSH